MSRIRTIKPDFWSDSKTGTLSGDATKLLIGMWNFADDYGVIRFDVWELKARIFPFAKEDAEEFIAPLVDDELIPRGLVHTFFYEEKPFLLIHNFNKHQKVDRPSNPIIPRWTESDVRGSIIKSISRPLWNPYPRRVLANPSLCKGKEGKGMERKVKEVKKESHGHLDTSGFLSETLGRFAERVQEPSSNKSKETLLVENQSL